MAAASFIFDPSKGQTAEGLKRQREAAQQSMAAGASIAPVSGTTEALARVLQGGIGEYFAGQAERDQNYAALPAGVKTAAEASPAFDGFAQASVTPFAGPGAPAQPATPFNLFRMGTFGLPGKR